MIWRHRNTYTLSIELAGQVTAIVAEQNWEAVTDKTYNPDTPGRRYVCVLGTR